MAKKRSDEDERKILAEARTRYRRCEQWESNTRDRQQNDIKFVEGDSDNLYQWPEDIRGRMEAETKPMLTVNKTKQHCLDILNDARQSRVAIKIRATGDGSSVESAEVYNGVIRHVEYISNAGTAYQTGLNFAVRGGIGYWRVITGYANDDSFDQEIFVRRIKDPFSVYLDPDINEFDGSDARYGFIGSEMPKEEWEAQNKDRPRLATATNALAPGDTWVRENTVRIAEYFRRIEQNDTLIAYLTDPDDPDSLVTSRKSEMNPRLAELMLAIPTTKTRTIKTHRVEWFKIVGDEITEEREWLGIYIPIVRCVGEETVIDGELDRKGHVRALKDPQRMFNYNASGSIEYGALQSKTPYIGPADAFEGYETFWETANTENHAFMPFNHRDDEGETIPAPQRQEPPRSAPVFMQGMQDAAEWMRMVSGQYQADMGAPGNERSGVAIEQRQRQGDNATYHFLDHQAIAIRYTGKILIDLIPKVYDTERVLKIRAEDGAETEVKIDPNAQEAVQKNAEDREQVKMIFNPSVGKYDVEADVGPAFATKRQEAFNAYTQLLAQNKDLTSIIGDLMLMAADFPGAEEAAERLKRMVPKQALEDGPSPDLLAAQQQIQALQQFVTKLAQKLADKTAEHRNDGEKNAVTAYQAQTQRLAALKDALGLEPERLAELVRQVIMEAEATSTEGLAPALTPNPLITPQDVMPPQQQAPQGAPQGMQGSPGGDMVDPNMESADMGSGPAPQPSAAPLV